MRCGHGHLALALRKTGSVTVQLPHYMGKPPHSCTAEWSHRYVFCVLLGEISALIVGGDPNAFLDKRFDTTPGGCQPQEVCFYSWF